MMKKTVIASIATATLLLSGCANNGLAINTLTHDKVARYFHSGIVLNQKKVVINDRDMAVLTGAAVGAVGGAITGANSRGNTVKGGFIGGAIGGILGAVIGKEVVAYQTFIKYDNDTKTQICYVKNQLKIAQKVEFTIENKKCKNVNLISQYAHDYKKTMTATTKEEKIIKRAKRSGIWFYKLQDGTVVNSKNFYDYKGDIVKVKYSNKDNQIISIIRTKCLTCERKKVEKVRYILIPKIKVPVVKKTVKKQTVKTQKKEKIIKKQTVKKNVPDIKKEVKKQAVKKAVKNSNVWG